MACAGRVIVGTRVVNTTGGVVAILFALFLGFLILSGKGSKVWKDITGPSSGLGPTAAS